LSCISIFVVILNLIYNTGGSLNFDLSKVYDHRSMYAESYSSGFFGYLNSWVYKIFSVILLLWSISKNKKIVYFFTIFIVVLLFGLSGHKSALISLFLVPFFYYVYKSKKPVNSLIYILLSFLGLSYIYLYYSEDLMYGSIIFRRSLMTPSELNYKYLEFFSNNSFVYWSDGILKNFNARVYDVNIPYVIGRYLGSDELGANTGFIATGYAQAGFFGIFLYTVICIVIMNFINLVAKRNKKYVAISIIFIPLSTLFISSDLATTLLTHGLLIYDLNDR
jgi:hypothetical protein